MKRFLSLLLLFGAVLGLLGQEAAFASAPAIPIAQTAIVASTMSDECAEMMGIDKSDDSAPCKGLTLDCIAKMGCAVPLAVETATMLLATTDHSETPDRLPVTRLHGRNPGPELDPPLIHG